MQMLFQGGFKVSSGTVQWYRSSSGTDFDNFQIASPAHSRSLRASTTAKTNLHGPKGVAVDNMTLVI